MKLLSFGWNVWWRLLRPQTLTASFVPVFIGTALALPYHYFRPELFICMLLASILIQSATNMFNEYYDYERGLDDRESQGIGGTIVRDGVSPQAVYRLAIACLCIALFLGVYISSQSSWWILLTGFCCMIVAYLYSGGPYPISSTPFGELMSGACMGTGIILIAFFIQTGIIGSLSLMVSVPTSILIGAILMANNIRDIEGDKKHGRKTLAILMGRSLAVTCLAGMFGLAYLWVILLVASGLVPVWALLSLISLPKAVRATSRFREQSASREPAVKGMIATAQTNTIFGLALSAGLFLHYLLS